MSRIVVKNLPKKITAEKLQELFSSKGHVTDVKLKYAASGVFRQFAFIGFRTEEEAKEAQKYFHNTFIQTSKIKVEMCHPLGEVKQAWSKYSKQVSKKHLPEKKTTKENVKELKQDSQLSEYLEVTGNRKSKPSWRDHAVELEDASVKKKEESHGSGDSSDSDGDDEISDDSDAPPQEHMSDMEYLKSKIKTSQNIAGDGKSPSKQKKKKAVTKMFTVKLKKLPYSCKKKHLKAFFLPLKPKSIRIPRGKKGFAYVGFSEEKDMKKALNKNRGFLEGHRVDVLIYHQKAEEIIPQEVVKEVESHESKESSSEIIAETGRLFVRNLCFTVTEEELNELFSKYGSIAEIHIPTDFYTKQGLGYAFVSYVFAEHAVEAFTKLDGSIFQGRLLHIIPGKHKKDVILDPKEMTFKEKKAEKVKFMAQSSHTWNSLFLGFDAVSTIISERYKVPKAELLNPETPDSVAVRMALAETQLVLETKQFLLTHGIKLDAFGQSDAERSKTVILAKNLPANTTSEQVQAVFSKHGSVKKVLLPPSGVTAIVEFSLPSEAKTAFKKLAHSRFVNQVLFLEWAPVDVFCNEIQEDAGVPKEKGATESLPLEAEQKEEDDFHQEEMTIFVKNLNFETSEEDLKKHFKTCGPVRSVSIAKKPDLKTGNLLSMGFGFVTYKDKSSARTALNDLQFSRLDGHTLQLMFSKRTKQPAVATNKRKKSQATEQNTSKICVRNIPFGITPKEVESLFREFGELKFVRLPKRSDGTQGHRGFGFVDFFDKNCAKRAFDALCQSTHLLGRRLVLEWALPDSEDLTDLRKDTARKFYLQSSSEKRTKKRKLREDALLA